MITTGSVRGNCLLPQLASEHSLEWPASAIIVGPPQRGQCRWLAFQLTRDRPRATVDASAPVRSGAISRTLRKLAPSKVPPCSAAVSGSGTANRAVPSSRPRRTDSVRRSTRSARSARPSQSEPRRVALPYERIETPEGKEARIGCGEQCLDPPVVCPQVGDSIEGPARKRVHVLRLQSVARGVPCHAAGTARPRAHSRRACTLSARVTERGTAASISAPRIPWFRSVF